MVLGTTSWFPTIVAQGTNVRFLPTPEHSNSDPTSGNQVNNRGHGISGPALGGPAVRTPVIT